MAALGEGGYWALAFDTQWRIVAETAEQAAISSGRVINDKFHFGPEALDVDSGMGASVEAEREAVRPMGGWILADLEVDREGLRGMLHPGLRDVVDEIEPCDPVAMAWDLPTTYFGSKIGLTEVAIRVRDSDDHVVGAVLIT